MKESAEGVYNFFTANNTHAFYTGIGGRLYYRRAPQNPVFPYAVYFVVSGVPDFYFGSSPELLNEIFQFSVFTKKAAATDGESLVKNLRALFDNAALTITGWSQVQWVRHFHPTSIVIEQDGEVIHQENTDYSLIISK